MNVDIRKDLMWVCIIGILTIIGIIAMSHYDLRLPKGSLCFFEHVRRNYGRRERRLDLNESQPPENTSPSVCERADMSSP